MIREKELRVTVRERGPSDTVQEGVLDMANLLAKPGRMSRAITGWEGEEAPSSKDDSRDVKTESYSFKK